MPDQTPATDDDRKAHEWAHANKGRAHDSVARAIFRHVPAPPATLADELRAWGDKFGFCTATNKNSKAFRALADRVEAVEKHNDEIVGIVDDITEQRDEARAEVERLTAQVARQQQLLELNGVPRDTVVLPDAGSTPALPDPADVPAGEPWLVRDDQGLCLGLRCDPDDRKQPWCLLRVHNGTMRWRTDADVTLIRPVNISGLNPEETA